MQDLHEFRGVSRSWCDIIIGTNSSRFFTHWYGRIAVHTCARDAIDGSRYGRRCNHGLRRDGLQRRTPATPHGSRLNLSPNVRQRADARANWISNQPLAASGNCRVVQRRVPAHLAPELVDP